MDLANIVDNSKKKPDKSNKEEKKRKLSESEIQLSRESRDIKKCSNSLHYFSKNGDYYESFKEKIKNTLDSALNTAKEQSKSALDNIRKKGIKDKEMYIKAKSEYEDAIIVQTTGMNAGDRKNARKKAIEELLKSENQVLSDSVWDALRRRQQAMDVVSNVVDNTQIKGYDILESLKNPDSYFGLENSPVSKELVNSARDVLTNLSKHIDNFDNNAGENEKEFKNAEQKLIEEAEHNGALRVILEKIAKDKASTTWPIEKISSEGKHHYKVHTKNRRLSHSTIIDHIKTNTPLRAQFTAASTHAEHYLQSDGGENDNQSKSRRALLNGVIAFNNTLGDFSTKNIKKSKEQKREQKREQQKAIKDILSNYQSAYFSNTSVRNVYEFIKENYEVETVQKTIMSAETFQTQISLSDTQSNRQQQSDLDRSSQKLVANQSANLGRNPDNEDVSATFPPEMLGVQPLWAFSKESQGNKESKYSEGKLDFRLKSLKEHNVQKFRDTCEKASLEDLEKALNQCQGNRAAAKTKKGSKKEEDRILKLSERGEGHASEDKKKKVNEYKRNITSKKIEILNEFIKKKKGKDINRVHPQKIDVLHPLQQYERLYPNSEGVNLEVTEPSPRQNPIEIKSIEYEKQSVSVVSEVKPGEQIRFINTSADSFQGGSQRLKEQLSSDISSTEGDAPNVSSDEKIKSLPKDLVTKLQLQRNNETNFMSSYAGQPITEYAKLVLLNIEEILLKCNRTANVIKNSISTKGIKKQIEKGEETIDISDKGLEKSVKNDVSSATEACDNLRKILASGNIARKNLGVILEDINKHINKEDIS